MAIVQYWIGTHGPYEYNDSDAEYNYPEQMARKQDVADGITVLSNSVVTETGYGQSATPGVSDDASRSDHTHGTPAYPSRFPLAGVNYAEFESDGTIKLNGSATVFIDINIAAGSLGTGSSAPTKVNLNTTGIRGYAFNGAATVDELHGSFEIPHAYLEGSNISPHVHWRPTTANAGNVKWQLEYTWLDALGTVTSSTTISVTTAAGGTAWKEVISAFPDIVGTGKHIQSRIEFRLFRNPADAADTYADAAYLSDIGFHIEMDTIGSRTATTK